MNLRAIILIVAATLLRAGTAADKSPSVRASGKVQAVHSIIVQVPRVEGQGGNLTLAKLSPNGAVVKKGDILAEFDRTNELKLLREAAAKYDDLKHQVEQKAAEHRNNAEKRASDLQQAEGDLRKAEIEIRKGPILSEIEQQKNQVKLEDARQHVASLNRSNEAHDRAEAAESRILELQRDRQQVVVARQQTNANKLELRASIGGMVALESVWRQNSRGHAQEGDQVWPGSPLLRLFDPSEMEIYVDVGEPDGAVLKPGAKGIVHLDAFPGIVLQAHFESASPAAIAALGSSIKTFSALFRLDQTDPHLLPDLSAAIDIQAPK